MTNMVTGILFALLLAAAAYYLYTKARTQPGA